MLDNFYGELALSPFHTELSFARCSYGCAYCFARLAGDNKNFRIAAVMNSLKKCFDERPKRASNKLIRDGHALLLSNKTDPCAPNNLKFTEAVVNIARDANVPLAFQTKGAREAVRISELYGRPAFWYMTISSDNGSESEWEPGAPSCKERIEAAAELSSRGNFVMVGINPFVKEWINDIGGFVDRLKSAGIKAIWSEPLHLNYRQRNAMPQPIKDRYPDLIKLAMKLNQSETMNQIEEMLVYAESLGISGHHACRLSNAWGSLRKSGIYPKLFPTWHEFFDGIRRNWKKKSIPLVSWTKFEEYFDSVVEDYIFESIDFQHYFFNRNRRASENNYYRRGTLKELFRMGWNDLNSGWNPCYISNLAYIANDKNEMYTGEDGYPLIAIFDEPTTSNVIEISEV